MRLSELPETIALASDRTELPKDGRDEPLPSIAVVARFPEAVRLDPTRLDLTPEVRARDRGAWRGSIGSLLFHLLPLLALITWLRPPLDMPAPIPVQLVIEQPPPPPPPPPPKPEPQPEKPPPSGLHASDDFGEVGKPSPQRGNEHTEPTKGEPPAPPAEAKTDAAPPDPPIETQQLAAVAAPPPPPKPTPPKQQTAARVPRLEGLELPLPIHPDQPSQASASARFPGPNATRDEYCAYALHLTLEHIDLLPKSMLGARRGDTTVVIRVREDGTILGARVLNGSGYGDIDDRVVEMVKAVRQFPAFPLWLRGPVQDFTLHMHFPNPAQQ
jgi:periplasmic protein TonB